MKAQLRNRFVTASVVLTDLFFGATGGAQADDNFARLHKGAECSACHAEHRASKNLCADCHILK